MENFINYINIKTHNLKNISLRVPKHCFWGIAGPSGSGKSSLAYSTIYGIAKYEWGRTIGDDGMDVPDFDVEEYSGIIPSVALIQDNHNQNPRSTISSFLRLDRSFRLLYAMVNHVSPSNFSFNNPQYACPCCQGLGVEYIFSQDEAVNWSKSIKEAPFVLWKSSSYQQKVLEKYAESLSIDLTTPIDKLPKKQLDSILYSESTAKYRVSYSMSGKKHTKEFRYIGYFVELERQSSDKKHISVAKQIRTHSAPKLCHVCNGTRFSDVVNQYTYQGYSLGQLYQMEISDLTLLLTQWMDSECNPSIRRILGSLHDVLSCITNSQLGYLHLNRSIPSLSGGELQRLRMVNILQSPISDMLYIIDEPSAQLHVSEYDTLLSSILAIKEKGNTVLMVEHNPYFLKQVEHIIHLGPGAGIDGGQIVHKDESPAPCYHYTPRELTSSISVGPFSDNNLRSVVVDIPLNGITMLIGPSGSGKSTLARNIERSMSHCEYITQKPLRGSIASTIASYCGIMDDIRDLFSDNSVQPRDLFNFSTEMGRCPTCQGRGKIRFSLDFGKTEVDVVCEDCNGKRFSPLALQYNYRGFSIVELLSLTINQIVEMKLLNESKRAIAVLSNLQKVGLGYLSLFRTTDTLSGGECQRLKLVRALDARLQGKMFIFDEPLRGLGLNNACDVLSLFNDMVNKGATVLFVEHDVRGLDFCDYVVEMGPGKGKYGGEVLFAGPIEEFKQSKSWNNLYCRFVVDS